MYILNWLGNLNGRDIRGNGKLTQGDEICSGRETKAVVVLSGTALAAVATTIEVLAVAVAAAHIGFVHPPLQTQ